MTASLVIAVAAVGLVCLPHLAPLGRVTPPTAAAIWFFALSLRALLALAGAAFVFAYLPQTGLYDLAADWCWHEVVPLFATHLGFYGHPIIHAAVIVPGLALAASLVAGLFAMGRAWLGLRILLRRTLGAGPLGSQIIDVPEIVVGATGLGRGTVVISKQALVTMDVDEVRASLSHELGHLRRCHRPVLGLGQILAAIAAIVPGTGHARRQLAFALERDADDYAVRQTRDPLALASAICVAAAGRRLDGAIGLSGRDIALRLDHLEDVSAPRSRFLQRSGLVLAAVLAVSTLGLAINLPGWAVAAPADSHTLAASTDLCPPG